MKTKEQMLVDKFLMKMDNLNFENEVDSEKMTYFHEKHKSSSVTGINSCKLKKKVTEMIYLLKKYFLI